MYETAREVRLAARSGKLREPTAGHCPAYLQANLLILPERYTDDFRRLCRRNPVACPLLGESSHPGQVGFNASLGFGEIDVRTDLPGYNV